MSAIAVGSIKIRFAALPAILPALALALWLSPAPGWAYTYEQQQACMGDAFRLCSSEIPDIERVKACMVRQQADLSPACRVYFKPADPPAAPASTVRQAHLRKHKPIRNARRDDN